MSIYPLSAYGKEHRKIIPRLSENPDCHQNLIGMSCAMAHLSKTFS